MYSQIRAPTSTIHFKCPNFVFHICLKFRAHARTDPLETRALRRILYFFKCLFCTYLHILSVFRKVSFFPAIIQADTKVSKHTTLILTWERSKCENVFICSNNETGVGRKCTERGKEGDSSHRNTIGIMKNFLGHCRKTMHPRGYLYQALLDQKPIH